MYSDVILQRRLQVLYDKKWKRLLARSWVFRLIPFVDFSFAAGSMALGNVHAQSDFDIIIGARSGRIFTVRFFSLLFFGLLGWRRTPNDSSDKFCLNHFITQASYELSPPHSLYWQDLYLNLVPLYGTPRFLNSFSNANASWVGISPFYEHDLRYRHTGNGIFSSVFAFILRGRLGDFFENVIQRVQVRHLERHFRLHPPGYQPRICYTNLEIEDHRDTLGIKRYNEARIL
ncbi:MAG: hypothetical protein COU08_00865 [Candidatus Harrisonbacteria bacterium CG10_big_fil_rev_8_21_14_0_10_42_17]|uniref:Polymerase nucleotidyl transferase domain-containing protein n=1 Tax=Candidatus Harrisonbacteria bacterium CG10_big_fil_rev_8_21_14_0_10_42_17 TaxID=1974584 RepID=A0A2M6WIV3_9BACT|nr:MAG: hypothetical protein COU08_00865 [Candidatus Harrisonbacteria bacterium CG10_big_fil_rev_8_21_14_0_10_42_17]